jgi:phosphoribosyl 1,2-cyclic phosphodiesterase
MLTQSTMQMKFWGVRGSYAVPGSGTQSIGGNTPCIEINAGGHTIILDAGTGIIGLGRALNARARESGGAVEATVLFTHLHQDHIQGIPFFPPAYVPTTYLHFFGPAFLEKRVDQVLAENQVPPIFPVTLHEMPSIKDFQHIQGGDTLLLKSGMFDATRWDIAHSAPAASACGLVVRTHRSYAHPGGGVLCYRIEYGGHSIVYATDTEGYIGTDRRLAAFARGADVLIHDAQFTEDHYVGQREGFPSTQGHGHSTAQMACEVAIAAGVKHLILFHHDPAYDDDTIRGIETKAQTQFPNTTAAYEGLEIAFGNTDQIVIEPASPISLPMAVQHEA